MTNPTITSSRQNGRVPNERPDPEVVPRASRRRFSAAYKRRIVAEIRHIVTKAGGSMARMHSRERSAQSLRVF